LVVKNNPGFIFLTPSIPRRPSPPSLDKGWLLTSHVKLNGERSIE
jgi:hypothetical protein